MRPPDPLPVNLDRAAAFAVMSALFLIAYPRHAILCSVLLIAGAGAIELLQYLSPTRDPRLGDAAVKAAGALVGAAVGWSYDLFGKARAGTPPD